MLNNYMFFTVTGTTVSVCGSLNYGGSVTFLQLFGKAMSNVAFPAVLLGGMYGATTCMMDQMRGKDKPLSNGLIGGAVAGAVLGTKSHNPAKITSYAVMFGILGFAARFMATNGLMNDLSVQKDYDRLHREVVISDMKHLSANAK